MQLFKDIYDKKREQDRLYNESAALAGQTVARSIHAALGEDSPYRMRVCIDTRSERLETSIQVLLEDAEECYLTITHHEDGRETVMSGDSVPTRVMMAAIGAVRGMLYGASVAGMSYGEAVLRMVGAEENYDNVRDRAIHDLKSALREHHPEVHMSADDDGDTIIRIKLANGCKMKFVHTLLLGLVSDQSEGVPEDIQVAVRDAVREAVCPQQVSWESVPPATDGGNGTIGKA
jgi:hypothetical protein